MEFAALFTKQLTGKECMCTTAVATATSQESSQPEVQPARAPASQKSIFTKHLTCQECIIVTARATALLYWLAICQPVSSHVVCYALICPCWGYPARAIAKTNRQVRDPIWIPNWIPNSDFVTVTGTVRAAVIVVVTVTGDVIVIVNVTTARIVTASLSVAPCRT